MKFKQEKSPPASKPKGNLDKYKNIISGLLRFVKYKPATNKKLTYQGRCLDIISLNNYQENYWQGLTKVKYTTKYYKNIIIGRYDID